MANEASEKSPLGSSNSPVENSPSTSVPESRIVGVIKEFSAIWFTVSMCTGIISILMHQIPYQFNALPILQAILFVFNVVLFTIFSIITLIRWTIFFRFTVDQTFANPAELSFLGAAPIAFFTIITQVSLTVSTAYWGGHWATILACVLWWICTFWMLFTSVLVYGALFTRNLADDRSLPTAVFLPAVGTTTNALVGGIIAKYSSGISARLAVPIVITSYFLTGYGMFIAIVVYVIFMHRLIAVGWPSVEMTPTVYLTVGPMGQSAAALLALGSTIDGGDLFGQYGKGTLFNTQSGSVFYAAGTLLAMIFLGFDIFWIFMSLYVTVEAALHRGLFKNYTMFWWSTIFPFATVNTSFIFLSEAMDSPTFRTLAAGLLIILILDYFANWFFVLKHIWQGKLLSGKTYTKQAEEEQQKRGKRDA